MEYMCPLGMETGEVNPRLVEGALRLHHSSFHDQNEDTGGEQTDPATGLPYTNDCYTGLESLTIVGPFDSNTDDVLPPLPENTDAAAKWLEENEPAEPNQNNSTAA